MPPVRLPRHRPPRPGCRSRRPSPRAGLQPGLGGRCRGKRTGGMRFLCRERPIVHARCRWTADLEPIPRGHGGSVWHGTEAALTGAFRHRTCSRLSDSLAGAHRTVRTRCDNAGSCKTVRATRALRLERSTDATDRMAGLQDRPDGQRGLVPDDQEGLLRAGGLAAASSVCGASGTSGAAPSRRVQRSGSPGICRRSQIWLTDDQRRTCGVMLSST